MNADETFAEMARAIIGGCDKERSAALHVALCDKLREQNANTFDGVMALLWTAIHQLSKSFEVNGRPCARQEAELIVLKILFPNSVSVAMQSCDVLPMQKGGDA